MLSSKYFIVVTTLSFIGAIQAHSFCVSSQGINDEACVIGDQSCCCKSLQFLIQNLTSLGNTSNVLINIQDSTSVDGIIYIHNFKNLTIQGGQKVKISCIGSPFDTGVSFENVSRLVLVSLVIERCGMRQMSAIRALDEDEINQQIWCAVYIINSEDIMVDNVTITNSKGTGIVVYDTSGNVTFTGSTFKNNKISERSEISGGGGLMVDFTYCYFDNIANCTKEMQNTSYVIQDCDFIENAAIEHNPNSSSFVYQNNGGYQGFGRGGGLSFNMRGITYGNRVHIKGCNFISNTASTWGGGVYLSLRDNPTENIITFEDCQYTQNKCTNFGGGGLKVSLLSYEGKIDSNNITFRNCNFTSNSAMLNGGGVSIVATRQNKLKNIDKQLKNALEFHTCVWYRNKARLGSAVDISPAVWDVLGTGILPSPKFTQCSFKENYVTVSSSMIHTGIIQETMGVGTLFISNFGVDFSSSMDFISNSGTPIYLQSGNLKLDPGTELKLIGNKGAEGGAIAMYAFSVIFLTRNNNILFENNEARIRGGAIHAVSMDKHERYSSKSCFFQTGERNMKTTHENIIIFKGNKAQSNEGNSIYASSLQPCLNSCSKIFETDGYFECIAHTEGLNKSDITTRYYKFTANGSLHNLVPGKFYKVPIQAYDELGKTKPGLYEASLKNMSIITLDEKVMLYASSTKFRVHANETLANDVLHLTNEDTRLSIDITVIECPPGHITNMFNVCVCGTTYFKGIWKCDRTKKVVSIINGYWIGSCGKRKQCTGHCPVGYCTTSITTKLVNTRIQDTSKLLCINNREGKLCGNCIANYSVYYHSTQYKCGKEVYCKYGIIFYLLSEIVPLTIVFIVIIMLNISFTNGAINGFILYAQIFDSLIINFYAIGDLPSYIDPLTKAYKAIYTTSNMNYFSIDQLSFCLWQGATTLDIIAWKYFTIVYGFCLILVTVFLLNTTTCKKLCICWRPHNLKNAVIHGLTAFLVMCYSQCARVSFILLTTTTLTGYKLGTIKTVVLFSGENEAFDGIHSKYAIPALLFITVIVLLPPLILFLYPLSFKLLALCHLSELKVVNFISNKIPMQLFDSFQSCYEDKFRFFSGLYFFYRIVPLILYAANTDMILFYFCVEVFLIMALALNATLQPYKNKWHNVTDSLIFTNLAIINAISLYNYQIINEGKDNLKTVTTAVTITTTIQLILIYLPLLYIVVCFFWLSIRWLRKKLRERKISKLDYSKDILLDSTYLPPLRDEMSAYSEHNHEFHMM